MDDSALLANYSRKGSQEDFAVLVKRHADWVYSVSPPVAVLAFVATSESTASTSYVDLATTTDTVTVIVGAAGIAEVALSHVMSAATVNPSTILMSFAMSGANTQAATDKYNAGAINTGGGGATGNSFLLTGLTPGSTTFKAKYRVTGGTMGSSQRLISVKVL